jgi:hypothetical protein
MAIEPGTELDLTGQEHRQRLPNRRDHLVLTFDHNGMRCRGGVGHYDDGRLAEVFLNLAKDGSAADVNARDAAIAASLALQFGCPPETLRRALTRNQNGGAAGPLGALLDLLAQEQSTGGDP